MIARIRATPGSTSKRSRVLAVIGLISGLGVTSATTAGATDNRGRFTRPAGLEGDNHSHGPATCTGTPDAPGLLAGVYPSNVVITGVCLVNGGPATINGDLILAAVRV